MQDKQLRVLIVEGNSADAKQIQLMFARTDPGIETVRAESLDAARTELSRDRFNVALLNLALPDSNGLATLQAIQSHSPGLPLVLLTDSEGQAIALDALKRGAQDYLIKESLSGEALVQAVQYASLRGGRSAEAVEPDPVTGNVIGILGAKGGVGTTTVACHHAAELKRQTGKNVLLVDLDPTSATMSFLLKVRSNYSTLDASANLHRLDAAFWKGIVSSTPHGVDVLQSPGAIRFGEQLTSERVRHILRSARVLYDWIVIDFGRLTALSMALVGEANEIFVVTTQEKQSVCEAGRLFTELSRLGVSEERVRAVVNRAPKFRHFSVADVERSMGVRAYSLLTDSSGELENAHAEGRSMDPGLRLRKQIGQMVNRSLGFEQREAKRWFGLSRT